MQEEVLIKEFHEIGIKKNFKSQYFLITPNDTANKIYIVLGGGLVLLHIHPKTGIEKAINFFTPTFHPMATVGDSFHKGETSKFYLKTFTNTTVLEIDKNNFDYLLKSSEYSEYLYNYAIKSLLEKNEIRAMSVVSDSLEMLQFLQQKYPQILQYVPSKYIANFLGITPQWLSKLKHKL